MRNLKRALSLALASVMVIGMMVVGASAASYDDFSDKDEIVNKEAVQMLVELGVIAGKDDGSYDPTGIVTRAEMAKMICVVLNGGKDPSLGNVTNYSYADTVGHWAAAYIEYCSNLGIVAGDGTGNFNPNATVTGSEVAKMLLVAMGYKSEVEGFTGSNWAIGVNVRANQKGLYSDLSISVDAGLTRDSAAQMVYNALDATVVSYAYSINSDKKIKLINDTTTDGDSTKDVTFTKGKTSIGKVGASDKTYYANGNTVFFYTPETINGSADINVYSGYAKAPTLDANKAVATVYLKNDRVMAVVFSGKDLTTANVSDNLYISSVGTSTNSYTNAKAFIAGDTKLTDIKVSGSVKSGTAYTYSVNSDGYYELKAVPAGNSIADATVYLSNSSTVVFDKSGTKTELKITSKTLLVNHSEYLSDPVAELGAGPDVGDKITSVIYNGDDEALLIVIKNAEQKKDEDVVVKDYTKVTDKGGDLTIDHYQDSLSTAEIQSVLKTWAKADSVKYNAKDKTATFVGGSYDGNTLNVALNKVVNITVGGTNKYVDDATKLNELGLDGTGNA